MVTLLRREIPAALSAVAGSFVLAGSPAPAQIYVQAPPDLRVARVAYWDLNLATHHGEQALQMRVGNAIERVCLNDQGSWYGLSQPDYNHCVWGAWQRARPQMAGAVYRARQASFYRAGYYRGY